MATQLQIRRGTASQIAAFTGAEGEVSANTTNESLHVHNGSTAGGFETARADLNNVSDASLNAALTGNTVSALTITTLTLGSTAITATGAEINILDGVTATAAELNILDGVTSTAAELNILDGVTATTAELNFADGVTSAIQTQIDAKAPLASPTFTGTVNAAALTVDTTTLVVDATNNRVGIGASSPRYNLAVSGNSATAIGIALDNASGSGTADISILGSTYGSHQAGPGEVWFYSPDNINIGGATGNTNNIKFLANNKVNMLIEGSSGNVLVGKTSTSIGDAGHTIFASGEVFHTVAGTPLYVNRTGSDGPVQNFYKDGTAVGSIGTDASRFKVKSDSIALYLENESNKQLVWGNVSGVPYFYPQSDNDTNIGYPTQRFKDLYLSGGAYLGGTAAANKINSYEEGSWTMGLSTLGGGFSATITNTTGTYTKVGNIVNVRIYTGAVNVSAAGSGTALITGLPFTVASSGGFNSNYSAASFAHTSIFSTTYEAYGAINQTYAVVVQVGVISTAAFATGNGKYMMFTLTYKTDA